MPSRVNAAIRYTLMPSTNYADVVATMEQLDEVSAKGRLIYYTLFEVFVLHHMQVHRCLLPLQRQC